MKNMEKFCRNVEDELSKIAEKGLNTSNLDTAYKLIDMYKDLKNTEYWDVKTEYYSTVLEEMNGGYSQKRMENDHSMMHGHRRDERGRYSRESGNNYEMGESYGRHYDREYYKNGHSGSYGMNDGTYDRYMDSKKSYRANKSSDCKQRLMQTLEDYMNEFSEQMEEMMRDSDCQEERATIKRYLDKIKNIA